jgi:C1A family cysteine protease
MSKRLHLLVLVLFLCRMGSPQLTNLITKYGDFASYKTTYAKTYSSESHETYRMSVHLENLKKYEAVNTNSTYTYKAGVSHFSDLTQAEYAATYLNIKHSESLLTVMREDAFVLTKDIDWTLQNKTTIVKDMGGCGASWAFAAVSVVESYLKSRSFPNPDLSEQQIIDCATLTSASGCESGLISNAL